MVSFDAVVFPGQGAQKTGMAKAFVEQFDEAKAAFEQAKSVLPFDPYTLCFEDDEKLNQTQYTQPCIVLAEAAMYHSLNAHFDFNPQYFAGHSLGEYAALHAAGVMPLDVTLSLVARRGELMQNTSVDGAMAAVIMDEIPHEQLQTLASQYDIDIANDNSISQVVLSGESQSLNKLVEEIEKSFAQDSVRVVKLNVSAPFHSRHMKDIEDNFYEFLCLHKDSMSHSPLRNVVSNYLGGFYSGQLDELLRSLAKQLSHSVKWRDNMAALLSKTNHILEVGPSRPLKGFFKTLGVDITAVINPKQAHKVFSHETI